jgi:hypothetical protein
VYLYKYCQADANGGVSLIGNEQNTCDTKCTNSFGPDGTIGVFITDDNGQGCLTHNDSTTCMNIECVTNGDPAIPPNSTDGAFDAAVSSVTVDFDGNSVTVPVTGTFAFVGGDCSGQCPITLTYLQGVASNAPVGNVASSEGGVVSDVSVTGQVLNYLTIPGTKSASGALDFPQASATVEGTFSATGTLQGQPFSTGVIGGLGAPASDLTGTYDASTKAFSLHGQFAALQGTASFSVQGTVLHRPPIAVASASQTVTCNPATGLATVVLDGSGSSDPDGLSVAVIWFEGNVILATTLVATVELPAGTNTVTLAVSANMKQSVATTTVTVLDDAPPLVTAPPDLSIATCTGARVDPGTPTVVDACESAAQLANASIVRTIVSVNGKSVNSPLPAGFVFEPGITVIRYDVTDVNGGKASVTQNVTVGPATTPWVAHHSYRTGDLVSFDGQIYQCIQAHTSQSTWTPPSTPALWEIPTPCGVVPWAPQTAYVVGSQVTFQGHTYECIAAHESQVGWTPTAAPSLWQRVR